MSAPASTDMCHVTHVPVDLIDPDPDQPRRHFRDIEALAASIAEAGQAQPVLVRPVGDRYALVHGERRWLAIRHLGQPTIRAEVRDVEPADVPWLQLAENLQRDDLSPIEEANFYRRHVDSGLSHDELARRVGKTRTYVTQKLRLLTLPGPLAYYLDERLLTEGHARQLLRIRPLYRNAKATHLVWDRFQPSEAFIDEAAVASVMIAARPLDNPPYWCLPKKAPVVEACRGFVRYLAAGREQTPRWVIPAFWFATVASEFDLSVADLAALIGGFLELIDSAVVWTATQDPGGSSTSNTVSWFQHWGYASDLRHAGLTDRVPDLARRALETVFTGGYLLPSSCQPYGLQREAYLKVADGA
jgi:ParB/RepB/Spo0J family partition protein